ncbi:MAG: gluconate 2-dehydrogenase subunit 3 family protein [Niabella sp.]
MKRRESLKYIAASAFLAGIACNTPQKKDTTEKLPEDLSGFKVHRYEDELQHENSIKSQPDYFNNYEMETITILCDIIIPKDEVSGSASDAGVPQFIQAIVKEFTNYQTPLRGGLRWLDMQCLNKYKKAFKDCNTEQKIEIVDLIAYPERAKDNAALGPGVAFFTTLRNLTATGFYTSEIGVKDMGYEGNRPNQWNGIPDDVLKQYGLAYTERELNETVKFDS